MGQPQRKIERKKLERTFLGRVGFFVLFEGKQAGRFFDGRAFGSELAALRRKRGRTDELGNGVRGTNRGQVFVLTGAMDGWFDGGTSTSFARRWARWCGRRRWRRVSFAWDNNGRGRNFGRGRRILGTKFVPGRTGRCGHRGGFIGNVGDGTTFAFTLKFLLGDENKWKI